MMNLIDEEIMKHKDKVMREESFRLFGDEELILDNPNFNEDEELENDY